MEVAQAKGTARLLHLCVSGSTLLTGEQFDATALETALHGDGRTALLLYPATPDGPSLGLATPPTLDVATLAHPARLRLVVIDGTWRKSRKMLYLNPALQRLPRLALHDVGASGYLIRKAHLPDQLSTFEASCHALAQLEGESALCAPLLRAFDGFVAQQGAYVRDLKVAP